MQATYFLHIEKTAGTSLRSIIDKRFPADEICPAYHQDELLALREQGVSGYTLFRGHYRFSVQRYVTPTMPNVLVMLRDPVQRTISHLKHLQRDRKNNELLRARLPVNDLSLAELASNPFIIDYLRAFQTKKLGLGFDPSGIRIPLRIFDPAIRYDQALLANAKKNLDQCYFVGLTEQFHESVDLLCRLMGWDYAEHRVPHENRAPEADEFDLPEKMHEALAMDHDLYDHARTLFHERLRSVCGTACAGERASEK